MGTIRGVLGLVVLLGFGGVADLSATATEDPLPIVNGTEVGTCGWPTTVALLDGNGGLTCSATLVHPQVVLTAAHCVEGLDISAIAFGEDVEVPEFEAEVAGCAAHPDYQPSFEQEDLAGDIRDLAFCTLTAPVTNVRPTPIASGCEVEELGTGSTVQIVGFGASENGDAGRKRQTPQTIQQIDEYGQIYLVGEGDNSACFGDSGGPAYFQVSDGSWRVIGSTSRALPDAPEEAPCGPGAIYTGAFGADLEWLESASGYDLTPCHATGGQWEPTELCTDFELQPTAEASWAQGCGEQPISGFSSICGPAFGDDGSSSGSDDSGGSESSSSTGDGESSSGGGDESSGTPPFGGTTGEAEGDSTETGEPAADDGGQDGDAGCGCRTPAGPSGFGWLALLVLVTARRRRTSARE